MSVLFDTISLDEMSVLFDTISLDEMSVLFDTISLDEMSVLPDTILLDDITAMLCTIRLETLSEAVPFTGTPDEKRTPAVTPTPVRNKAAQTILIREKKPLPCIFLYGAEDIFGCTELCMTLLP